MISTFPNLIQKRIFYLFFSLFLIFSCTGYHEMKSSGSGGYGTFRLEDGNLEIIFSGNMFTPERRIKRFLMLRCAEVTVESGCKYFRILKDLSYKTNYNGRTAPGNYSTSRIEDASYVIEIVTELPDKDKDYYYDAKEVIDSKGRANIRIFRY